MTAFFLSMLTFKNFLWLVYVAILVVITPHTQWMFAQFEPKYRAWVSWVAAIGFEATIFVVTHLLVAHIERRKAGTFNFEKQRLKTWLQWWPAFRYRWLNVYTLLLGIACVISGAANLSHAVEFSGVLKIVTDWGVPAGVLTVAFGGILPLVNLLFAAVIADVDDTESIPNPELDKANGTITDLRKQLKESEAARKQAEQLRIDAEAQWRLAEQRYDAIGDLVVKLFAEDKRQRILAIKSQWPALPGSAIAIMSEASPSYVSEVLSEVRS